MLQQDTRYPARGPVHSKQVSAAHITAAAFGIGAGLARAVGIVDRRRRIRRGDAPVDACGDGGHAFVLTLILVSALAHDSQQAKRRSNRKARSHRGPAPHPARALARSRWASPAVLGKKARTRCQEPAAAAG